MHDSYLNWYQKISVKLVPVVRIIRGFIMILLSGSRIGRKSSEKNVGEEGM